MKKLGNRLAELANFVPTNTIVADIGTDHAWLPIDLMHKRRANKVYAMDNKLGPLNQALKNIIRMDLVGKIECIHSSGLEKMPQDVEIIIIAGMGPQTIIKILESHFEKVKQVQRLILQPNFNSALLRQWINNHQFMIIDESIVVEKGVFYEIIVVEKGDSRMNKEDIEYGPILRKKKDEIFLQKYLITLVELNKILKKMPGALTAKQDDIYLKLEEIKKLLE